MDMSLTARESGEVEWTYCMLGFVVSSLILSVVVYFSLGVRILMFELITYYVIGSVIIGLQLIFFLILYAATQNTKGRMVGYKDHKTYGDSSIYENTPSDNTKFYLELGVTMTETLFTITSIAFFVLLAYSVEQLSETY